MSTSPEPQQILEDLAHRICEQGFRFRRAPDFGAPGVLIYSPPVLHGKISAIERSVFIYARGSRWEARVTQHGGPHWIREAESIDRLEEVALEALRSAARPPASKWKVERS